MKKTKEIKRELEEIQGSDYLHEYYYELTDNTVPQNDSHTDSCDNPLTDARHYNNLKHEQNGY